MQPKLETRLIFGSAGFGFGFGFIYFFAFFLLYAGLSSLDDRQE